jgi:hypothetical protein
LKTKDTTLQGVDHESYPSASPAVTVPRRRKEGAASSARAGAVPRTSPPDAPKSGRRQATVKGGRRP